MSKIIHTAANPLTEADLREGDVYAVVVTDIEGYAGHFGIPVTDFKRVAPFVVSTPAGGNTNLVVELVGVPGNHKPSLLLDSLLYEHVEVIKVYTASEEA